MITVQTICIAHQMICYSTRKKKSEVRLRLLGAKAALKGTDFREFRIAVNNQRAYLLLD